jgi:hypothetical protein
VLLLLTAATKRRAAAFWTGAPAELSGAAGCAGRSSSEPPHEASTATRTVAARTRVRTVVS